MSRILCLDLGERRTGVAISDETRTIAQSLTTITHRNESELLNAIEGLVKNHQVEKILIGLPLSLSGKESTRSRKVRSFARRLAEKFSRVRVELFDERFSTNSAQRLYTEVYGKPFRRNRSGRKNPPSPIDRIAATIILENYLARHRETG